MAEDIAKNFYLPSTDKKVKIVNSHEKAIPFVVGQDLSPNIVYNNHLQNGNQK